MKILFIVPYPTEGPSNRFRVEQYLPALRENGIKFKIRPFCNTYLYNLLHKKGHYLIKIFYLIVFTMARLADIFRSLNYGMVFIHREAFPAKNYIFERFFRLFAKKIIYDFDDSIFLTKPSKVRNILRSADYVIAGNPFLQEYAFAFNRNITVIPTPVDTDRYFPGNGPYNKSKIVIGWIGTSSTSAYLSSLEDVFKYLSGKYSNIEFRVIGGKVDFCPGIPVSKSDWSLATEVEDLQAFDIGIMPMPDNDWTRGKCAFKAIQYMAVGIPSVASSVGMNKGVINDGVNGFLASTDKEWCDKLSALIDSPSLRQSIGKKGRETIEERYSLKVSAPKFLSILKKVM